MKFNFNCKPTIVGTLPYADPEMACAKSRKYLKDFPAWPQLPGKSNLENMYIQFSEGFPGIVIDNQKIRIEKSADFDDRLEKLFSDSSENKFQDYGISKDHAAGLHSFISTSTSSEKAIKGHITGPISWGLCVTDDTGKGIIYDDTLADALAKFLNLKARWQENLLKSKTSNVILFFDEPYLASLGSAFVSITPETVSHLINETLSGIKAITGIHCCGATDWSLLLKSSTDILNFDAYNYADSLLCYHSDVTAFLQRGGAIAWGIVPNDEDIFKKESTASLFDRFCETAAAFSSNLVSFKDMLASSLITPSCGLASVSPEASEEILNTLAELSDKINKKYIS